MIEIREMYSYPGNLAAEQKQRASDERMDIRSNLRTTQPLFGGATGALELGKRALREPNENAYLRIYL
jgi:hypothetical protein